MDEGCFASSAIWGAGQMVLGSSTFEFSAGRIYSYMYSPLTQEVRWYGLEFTGSGPTTSNGGAFGSLAVSVEPDLDLWSDIGAIALQYLYTSPSGSLTQYAYAGLSGRWSAARGNAVPLPATPWLVIAGLAALTFRPRPRRNRAAASDEPLA